MNNLIASPVMFRNHPLGFLINLVLCLTGIGILIFIYWYYSNKTTKLSRFDDKIIYESGIIARNTVDTKISNIKSIKVKQSICERLFNVGTLSIYTAGDRAEIRIKGIKNPMQIKNILNS